MVLPLLNQMQLLLPVVTKIIVVDCYNPYVCMSSSQGDVPPKYILWLLAGTISLPTKL
jgi:hypothetical protein